MNRPEFVRFHDLTPDKVNRDLQVHTTATDGEATVAQMIKRAEELGLKEIAFTEHVRRTSTYYRDFVAEVQAARQHTTVQVYVGIEAKAEDQSGILDVSPETIAQAEIVLGSVHRFPTDEGRLMAAEEFDYQEATQREFALALGLVRHAPIHVLAHPGGMCQRAFGKFPVELFEALMVATLQRGIAIEINTSYTRDLDGFLDLCQKVNPIVSVGSDAHRLTDLATCRNALWTRGIGCE